MIDNNFYLGTLSLSLLKHVNKVVGAMNCRTIGLVLKVP